jgi:predicted nucleic acid binding AN1-type Zn finger protein
MAETLQYHNTNIICDKKVSIGCCNISGCIKKLGIMSFVCRCKKEFCAKHRMPETHQCTFDYKTSGREALKKANQQIIHIKIVKF